MQYYAAIKILQHTQQREWISELPCRVEGTRHKRLHMLYDLYKGMEQVKLTCVCIKMKEWGKWGQEEILF